MAALTLLTVISHSCVFATFKLVLSNILYHKTEKKNCCECESTVFLIPQYYQQGLCACAWGPQWVTSKGDHCHTCQNPHFSWRLKKGKFCTNHIRISRDVMVRSFLDNSAISIRCLYLYGGFLSNSDWNQSNKILHNFPPSFGFGRKYYWVACTHFNHQDIVFGSGSLRGGGAEVRVVRGRCHYF